ncbi:pancreatic lipase-related protein 2-like isoform X2 [Chrysoperla carnea]|uniref:pancreatic lipase-related protein 2-like isoform X2 n=1 Tax=Chrysoperla carnea TaxID=189513 RepID=UPI001D08D89F|nr:pancreatic lipase-related protein 2-like isoform X2 [Chrysoperla carnea]
MRRTYIDYRIIQASKPEQILAQDIFNPLRKTVMFIPGDETTLDNPNVRPLLESYINSKQYNVIHMDAYKYTSENAPGLMGEILHWLGDLYASILSTLIKLGLRVDDIQLVGHSYGASIAYLVAKQTTPKLPLLVGLDPVFYDYFQKGYADYTIVLHSNIGQIGTHFYNSADSNLIANDGTIQPKCTDRNVFEIESDEELAKVIRCSHVAAAGYWAGMIENPELFFGVQCNATDCNYAYIVQLGPNLRKPGQFYFKTSKNAPYGLGLDGVKNITPINTDLLKVYHYNLFQDRLDEAKMLQANYISDIYNYEHHIHLNNFNKK